MRKIIIPVLINEVENMKIVLKAIAVVVCAALLIWNAAQLKAIGAGTKEVPMSMGTMLLMIPWGNTERQPSLGLSLSL